MFNPEIIFITISLVLLAGVAYWMRVPQVIIPLSIVYLLFVLLSDPSPKSLPNLQPIKNSTLVTEQKAVNKSSRNFEPLETTMQPTPLTFDSGRTTKSLVKKRIMNQSPKTLNKRKVKKNQNQVAEVYTLRLRDIQICKNVVNRMPEGTDIFFNNNVSSKIIGDSNKIVVAPNDKGPNKAYVWPFIQPASEAVRIIEFIFIPN